MMLCWAYKYLIVLLLFCFSISQPSISLAKVESDTMQQAFLVFEKKILDLIDSNMKTVSKLDEELDEESLYNIALSSEQKFNESSFTLDKLEVPISLPVDIKMSLEQVKDELFIGFKVLEKSMNYCAQYLMNRNPLLFDKFIEERDKGFLYIESGLTWLTKARLRLFYQLHKTVPIKLEGLHNLPLVLSFSSHIKL